MSRRRVSARLRMAALAVALAALTGSCVDPPFARVNPNDPQARYDLTIDGPDSSRTLGELLQFTATLDPPVAGYTPAFTASHNALFPVLPGRYQVNYLPPSGELVVLVTVSFGTRTATRPVTLRPALP